MPITHVPKWPVVHPNPSTGMALNNFHIMEYAQIVGFTVGGHLFGYYGGYSLFFSYMKLFYNNYQNKNIAVNVILLLLLFTFLT